MDRQLAPWDRKSPGPKVLGRGRFLAGAPTKMSAGGVFHATDLRSRVHSPRVRVRTVNVAEALGENKRPRRCGRRQLRWAGRDILGQAGELHNHYTVNAPILDCNSPPNGP